MSCSHLLVGLPLPLLPSILASKMCLSSVSWRLMWPKYLSFSVFAFCRSIVVFISNLESTSLLVTFSIQDILKIFYNISFQKMLSFLHLCCLWSMLHTHTRQLGIPLSLGLSVFFFLHCPFQIEIIFVNRVVAIASLLLISGVLFPFASNLGTQNC